MPNLTVQVEIFVPEYQVYLASPDDIACMKLSAIGSRGTKKDFIDLYFLIKNFKSLEEYLKLYARKFSTRDIGHILRSLVYFEDAESEPDIWMIRPLIWEELKADMERFVREITLNRIK
ncbi:MAG: nucleotidyl transferase AbiEii/AbiGii toxin family protein [Nitrospinae bacterium]|nr:nucleotidyl transferase AbiEii/AbiGii toxin family protein [Nitrospinota bacterium]